MDLSFYAHQRQNQSQKLILTAQMRESLKILQLSLPELKEYIGRELLENPALEYDSSVEQDRRDNACTDAVENIPLQDFCGDWGCRALTEGKSSDDDKVNPFHAVSTKPTFSDYLLNQLSEIKISPAFSKLCEYIIGNLNEKGYLSRSAEKIADDLGISVPTALHAIKIVQQLDPAGVCASDLHECLLLQLERLPDSDPCLFEIVNNDLELLSENKVKTIAKKLGIPLWKAQKYCNRIRSLNPIPSNGFYTGTTEIFVIPEAKIIKGCDGNFEIIQNDNYIPKLHISHTCLKLLKNPDCEETKKYIESKIKKARSLILMVNNREKTIMRILHEILKLQPEYFENGVNFLKPMSMKDIAAGLGMNESTICRAVQGKYILCSSGMVSIKSLFTCKLNAQCGSSDFSSLSVKEHISNLLNTENKRKPLSDQMISTILNTTEGIEISRRTVTKYRCILGIPSASKRRTYDDAI